jgi:Cu2+-exporting ATPase
VGAGLITLVVWLVLGKDFTASLTLMVTVLVIACPHALGLAIPLVTVNATGLSARNGILARNREAFERARNLRFVAFDKTGTLTEGRFEVARIATSGIDEDQAYRLAAGLEARSEHPLAKAVVQSAGQRAFAAISDFEVVAGRGVRAVARLKQAGVTPVMVTGDAEAVARTVADDLGIERYFARVLPDDKAARIRELKRSAPTAFVGDGINDAPALLEADLGVAIGAGTNVAIESADLVLVDDDPLDVTRALRLSRATYRKMVQNLIWATGYNAVAIPLAAGVLAPIGILLSPAVGALLMSLSTVIVAANAMLLRRVSLA